MTSTSRPATAFKQGEWNHFRIEAQGVSVRTWINDVPAADVKDDMWRKGHICFQVHSPDQNYGMIGKQVRWRNMRIKELDSTPVE